MATYEINYRPEAQADLIDTVRYISGKLKNTTAVQKIAKDIKTAIEELANDPHIYPVYFPLQPLKHEYRKFVIDNYIIFYTVEEREKVVTVFRVIYGKRNLTQQLK
ncbi:MAG: type II toxin-antitoxin system RelE/ParE family toxin [Clostridiales bacterium]|nr:type II toxin-antitoxin system RelE/ParE family toxin [Clostridiales bacterium]